MKINNLSFAYLLVCCISLFFINGIHAQETPSKTVPNKTLSTEKLKTTSKVSSGTMQNVYTVFWLTQCGENLTQKAKAGIPKQAITLNAENQISTVNMASIKKSLNYTSSYCETGAKPSKEYFIVQLVKDANIGGVLSSRSASQVPDCWTLRNLKSYISSCMDQRPAEPEHLGRCLHKNICDCADPKENFPCGAQTCSPMYLICLGETK